MTIDKLSEFASDGQKDVDDLVLTDGFPVTRKPARQWFNWLFNTLTSKINEIIDADFMPKSDVVDNLTTNDATKPVSAKQAKLLQDNKLDKTANAVSATKFQTARTINGVAFDGTANINLPTASTSTSGTVQLNNTLTSTSTTQALTAAQGKALQDGKLGRSENAVSASQLQTARTIGGVSFNGTANIDLPGVNIAGNQNTSGTATNCSRSIVAGNGLSGGGALTANHTLTLGTPGTVTASTGNTVSTSSHTHNLDVNSLPLLGVGQTWQNVTSDRSSGTTYVNNTVKPIQVIISVYSTANAESNILNVGGVTLLDGDLGTAGMVSIQSFVVPSGVSYSFTTTTQIKSWAELR